MCSSFHKAVIITFYVLCNYIQADEIAAKEFKSKYGFGKAPSAMAQRKISATVS